MRALVHLDRFLLLLLCVIWAASARGLDWIPRDLEIQSTTDTQNVTVDPTKVIILSWHPRAFLCEHFLTEEECDHLKNLASGKLTKSMVVRNGGKRVHDESRTSSGMFLDKAQDDIVKRIEDRIAAWTFLPPENGESIQVLRYQYGQKYEPHPDFFNEEYNSKERGGNRMATVLMYLSDATKGGETTFPSIQDKSTFKDDSWSECGKLGLAVKPKKGTALLFYNLAPNATPDMASRHMGCPVLEGEKWSATKWIHVSPFKTSFESSNPRCVDKHEKCREWASFGECVENPNYMVGDKSEPGACLKSCKDC
ncbi:unnamed protein product [Calypogeia fissa]